MFVRPKGKRKRAVPIPPELIEPLRGHFTDLDAERQAAGDDAAQLQPEMQPEPGG